MLKTQQLCRALFLTVNEFYFFCKITDYNDLIIEKKRGVNDWGNEIWHETYKQYWFDATRTSKFVINQINETLNFARVCRRQWCRDFFDVVKTILYTRRLETCKKDVSTGTMHLSTVTNFWKLSNIRFQREGERERESTVRRKRIMMPLSYQNVVGWSPVEPC